MGGSDQEEKISHRPDDDRDGRGEREAEAVGKRETMGRGERPVRLV